jgi:hypothetical protein
VTGAERTPWMAALKSDPVEWLLERDNPPVRYLTLTEILDRPPDDPEVAEAREAAWEWPPARALLDALEERPLDLDNLYRFGVPMRYEWPGKGTATSWSDATLWRVAVEPWKGDFEEVGVAVADPKEFPPLRDVMGEALAALQRLSLRLTHRTFLANPFLPRL